ncbi:uncharacterized protein [Ptychodera flava]|uniref:uncharacterized protein n=1 Tax=Ptychodera flava TaxID=63121 RepID=UPI00396A5003
MSWRFYPHNMKCVALGLILYAVAYLSPATTHPTPVNGCSSDCEKCTDFGQDIYPRFRCVKKMSTTNAKDDMVTPKPTKNPTPEPTPKSKAVDAERLQSTNQLSIYLHIGQYILQTIVIVLLLLVLYRKRRHPKNRLDAMFNHGNNNAERRREAIVQYSPHTGRTSTEYPEQGTALGTERCSQRNGDHSRDETAKSIDCTDQKMRHPDSFQTRV